MSSKPWTGVTKKVLVKDALSHLQQAIQSRNSRAVAVIGQSLQAKVPHNNRLVYLEALWLWQNGYAHKAYEVMRDLPQKGLITAELAANLATLARQLGFINDALDWIKQAISFNQQNIHFLQQGFDLGKQANRLEFSRWCAQQLVAQQPDHELHWDNLFQTLESTGQWSQALALTQQAIEKFPTQSQWLFRCAAMQERLHLLEPANTTLEQAFQASPQDAFGHIIAARIQRRENHPLNALRTLSQIKIDDEHVSLQKAYWAEKVLLQRAVGACKETLLCAAKMHQLSPLGDIAAQEQAVEDYLHNVATADVNDLRKQVKLASPIEPLFIVGFPRCGSTLIEKLIFSHFKCINGDENIAVESVERDIYFKTGKPWWELNATDITSELLAQLSATLCANYFPADETNEPATLEMHAVTDKNLTNLTRLPLISLLFPNAPIIKIVRHPLDTVLSTFFNAFATEHPWQQELPTIAKHYARLETHSEEVLAKLSNPVYTLHYEDVALSQQLPVDLINFLHQHWQVEKRTHAYTSDVPFITRTASYAQVQAPVNNASIQFSQPYVEFIENEVHEVLAPYNQRWLEYWSIKGESNE